MLSLHRKGGKWKRGGRGDSNEQHPPLMREGDFLPFIRRKKRKDRNCIPYNRETL